MVMLPRGCPGGIAELHFLPYFPFGRRRCQSTSPVGRVPGLLAFTYERRSDLVKTAPKDFHLAWSSPKMTPLEERGTPRANGNLCIDRRAAADSSCMY